MNGAISSLFSLLPPHSFVMGRKANPGAVTPEVSAHSSVCSFCGGEFHSVEMTGDANPKFVFSVQGPTDPAQRFEDSPEGQLFSKIKEAMKLGSQGAALWVRRGAPSESDAAICASFQLKELKKQGAGIVVALGEAAGRGILGSGLSLQELRGRLHLHHGIEVLVTESLTGMLANPNLKKQAWEDLKLALKS